MHSPAPAAFFVMHSPPSGTQVHAARPDDAEPLLGVLCAAFGLDCEAARPLFYQDPYFDLSRKWVLTTPQGGLVACLTVIPSTLIVRGVALPTGGIAGVATHPSHQGRGYASHLLAETVKALAGEGAFPLSALFPYSEAFYRRLGWETAARARQWTGTLPLPQEPVRGGHVRPAFLSTPYDRELLQGLRAMLPPSQTGLCRRDHRRWRVLEMTTTHWEWHVFEAHDICSGYVALQRSDDPAAPIIIHEMLAATEDARRALVTFLSQVSHSRVPLAWATSADLPAAFGLPACAACQAVDPGMMLRVVDLPAVLRALHPVLAPALARARRSLTISALDPLFPGSAASWRLSAHGVEPGTAADPECLRAPVSALAPLVSGDCLPSALAAQGQLEASSPATLALADTLFPLTRPFIAPADQF